MKVPIRPDWAGDFTSTPPPMVQAQVPECDRWEQPPLPGDTSGQALQGWRCWRISPAFTRHQNSSPQTTGRSLLLRPYGIGVRPAPLPARLTSSRDTRGRTDSRNRSMDVSGLSSSTSSCSLQPLRLKSWLIAGAGSATPSGRIQPLRGVRHLRQINRELQHGHIHQLVIRPGPIKGVTSIKI